MAASDEMAYRTGKREIAVCLVVAVLTNATTILFNGALNTVQSEIIDTARDWATSMQALEMIVLMIAARLSPRLVRPLPLSVTSVFFVAAGSVLASMGVAHGSSSLLITGVCFSSTAIAWETILFIVLCSMLSPYEMFLCLSGGHLVAILMAAAISAGGYSYSSAIYAISTIAAILLCTATTRGQFAEFTRAEAASNAAITRPQAILPLTHDLFIFIFVFYVAYGFSLRYQNVDGGLLASWPLVLLIAALFILAAIKRAAPQANLIFGIAFACMLAGFLLVLLDNQQLYYSASCSLMCGSTAFGLLMVYALASVARRNRSNAIPAIAWGCTAYFAGIEIGAQIGLFSATFAQVDYSVSHVIIAIFIEAATLYTLYSMRDFGFDETIQAVQAEPEPPAPVQVVYADVVDARCKELSMAYQLTEREAEVFELLVRGNNTERMLERLGISKNTLKYHVRHIYEKAGVHSQQELIDLL